MSNPSKYLGKDTGAGTSLARVRNAGNACRKQPGPSAHSAHPQGCIRPVHSTALGTRQDDSELLMRELMVLTLNGHSPVKNDREACEASDFYAFF